MWSSSRAGSRTCVGRTAQPAPYSLFRIFPATICQTHGFHEPWRQHDNAVNAAVERQISTSARAGARNDHLVLGDVSAKSAGNLYSNRPACGVGAVVGADCRVSRCRLRHHRSALSGVDVLRHDVGVRHPNRSRQNLSHPDAAFSCRLLRVLRCRSWRRCCARSAAAGFRTTATPVPTRVLARGCGPDAGRSGRIEYPGPRATLHFLTDPHEWRGFGCARSCR
jgi:hypothetical protein